MPIFVDEVVISLEVSEAPSGARARAGGSAAGASATDEKQALVRECVEQVLEILARREER